MVEWALFVYFRWLFCLGFFMFLFALRFTCIFKPLPHFFLVWLRYRRYRQALFSFFFFSPAKFLRFRWKLYLIERKIKKHIQCIISFLNNTHHIRENSNWLVIWILCSYWSCHKVLCQTVEENLFELNTYMLDVYKQPVTFESLSWQRSVQLIKNSRWKQVTYRYMYL